MPPQPDTPSTINLIAGLLRGFLCLETEQVVIYNQKWKIPADNRLYVSVSAVAQRAYASAGEQYPSVDGEELLEDTSINTQETIGVDIYSRSQDAVSRKEEVLMAFASNAAQQLAEKYSLKYGRLPVTFVDLSTQEGTAILNRFHLAFPVLRGRTKTTVIEYFDKALAPGLALNP